MKSLLILINSHFWKSGFGPFFAFIFPIIFIAILGSLLGYQNIFGGALAISSMSVALTAMPQAIFEFKRSVLLKRIGVTPIKPWMFLVVAALFYFFIMFIATFWVIVIGIAIFSGNMNVGKEMAVLPAIEGGDPTPVMSPTLLNYLQNVNWGGFVWGLIMNIMIGVSIGLLIVSTVKSTLAIQAIGLPVLIISQFLAAQVLPLYMINEIEAMKYLSFLTPFKYSTSLMLESWSGIIGKVPAQVDGKMLYSIIGENNIFDIYTPYMSFNKTGVLTEFFQPYEKILNLVMPWAFTGLFCGICLKTFKWSTR